MLKSAASPGVGYAAFLLEPAEEIEARNRGKVLDAFRALAKMMVAAGPASGKAKRKRIRIVPCD